ncbi:MAG: hypothetical protein Kow00121_56040 [Elainellaceae cyanobacterium]
MDFLTPESLPLSLQNGLQFQEILEGQTLFQQGDQTSALYVVQAGRLKLVRYSNEERTITLQTVEPGEILGENSLFSNHYAYSAIAEAKARVIVYPKQLILTALKQYPELAEDFMAMLIKKIQALQIRIELRDIRAAHERVLQYLRYLAQAQSNVIAIDRPLKEIANELGLTPETLSRALTRLQNEGAITRQQNLITLHYSSVA